MSLSRASTPALIGLAALAVATYVAADRSMRPVRVPGAEQKLEAVRLMERAESVIGAVERERGIVVDPRNDPTLSGLVGPEFTLITTDRGSQAAKSLATNPNFAAAATELMLEAGVRGGDLVAIGMTGSFPGLDLAVLCACRAIGAEPLVITSAGASMFGATDPDLTWLDMESVLARRGLWPYRSLAASVGGGDDIGRGLSPAGVRLLEQAIARNGVPQLRAATVFDAIRERTALYDSVARARGRPLRLYVNVGGGAASLGGAYNERLIPLGLSRRLPVRNYPKLGVINVLGERGVPVIQLLQVSKLARRFGVVDAGGRPRPPDSGRLFAERRYNLWVVVPGAALLILANLLVLRFDLRQQLLGRPHPEKVLES